MASPHITDGALAMQRLDLAQLDLVLEPGRSICVLLTAQCLFSHRTRNPEPSAHPAMFPLQVTGGANSFHLSTCYVWNSPSPQHGSQGDSQCYLGLSVFLKITLTHNYIKPCSETCPAWMW